MIICLKCESWICCLEKPPDGTLAFGNHWGHLHGQYADSIWKLEPHQPNGMANYSCQLKALETMALPSQRSHFGTHRSLGYPEIGLDMVPNGPTEAHGKRGVRMVHYVRPCPRRAHGTYGGVRGFERGVRAVQNVRTRPRSTRMYATWLVISYVRERTRKALAYRSTVRYERGKAESTMMR